jgi:hypothetical protein
VGTPIQSTVGMSSDNRLDDVVAVRQLLNQLPQGQGGPLLLDPDKPRCDGELVAAIRNFQQFQFGWCTGIVQPQGDTFRRLDFLINGPGLTSTAPPVPDNIRSRTIEIALSQVGKVSDDPKQILDPYDDRPLSSQTEKTKSGLTVLPRRGWKILQGYMDDVMETPPNWAQTQTWPYTDLNGNECHITPLEGVKYQNMRVPLNGKTPDGKWNGVHWCGIFACWVLKQAGFEVRWGNSTRKGAKHGIRNGLLLDRGEPSQPTRGMVFKDEGPDKRENIKPGDICVIAAQSHHLIILKPPTDGNLETIAGNADYQSIMKETRYNVDDVVATYRVSPD